MDSRFNIHAAETTMSRRLKIRKKRIYGLVNAEETPVVEKREGKGKGKETMPTTSQGSSGQNSQGLKRQNASDSSAGGSRSKKGRGKGKISIGPDGSLSGF